MIAKAIRMALAMPSHLIIPAVLVLALASPASAQKPSQEEAQQACEADARRLCDEFIPNEAEIAACLKKELKHLSPACRKVVTHS